MDTDYELRQGCVLAVALCDMILRQELWPDLDPDSLREFRESVEKTRQYCLEAIQRFDAEEGGSLED